MDLSGSIGWSGNHAGYSGDIFQLTVNLSFYMQNTYWDIAFLQIVKINVSTLSSPLQNIDSASDRDVGIHPHDKITIRLPSD